MDLLALDGREGRRRGQARERLDLVPLTVGAPRGSTLERAERLREIVRRVAGPARVEAGEPAQAREVLRRVEVGREQPLRARGGRMRVRAQLREPPGLGLGPAEDPEEGHVLLRGVGEVEPVDRAHQRLPLEMRAQPLDEPPRVHPHGQREGAPEHARRPPPSGLRELPVDVAVDHRVPGKARLDQHRGREQGHAARRPRHAPAKHPDDPLVRRGVPAARSERSGAEARRLRVPGGIEEQVLGRCSRPRGEVPRQVAVHRLRVAGPEGPHGCGDAPPPCALGRRAGVPLDRARVHLHRHARGHAQIRPHEPRGVSLQQDQRLVERRGPLGRIDALRDDVDDDFRTHVTPSLNGRTTTTQCRTGDT